MAIKDVLREELQNSERMKKQYEKELKKLPISDCAGPSEPGNDCREWVL